MSNFFSGTFESQFDLPILDSGLANTITPAADILGDISQAIFRFDPTDKSLEINTFSSTSHQSQSIGDHLANSASLGNLQEVKTILSALGSIEPLNLKNAVIAALKNGHIPVVQHLLSNGRKLELKDKNEVFILAAENGFINVVRDLIGNDDSWVTEEVLGKAVIVAAKGGYDPLIRFLFLDSRTIQNEDLEEAVYSSTQHGSLESIKILLSGDRVLSSDQLEKSFMWAAENNRHEIIRFFLGNYEFSQDVLLRAYFATDGNQPLEASLLLGQASGINDLLNAGLPNISDSLPELEDDLPDEVKFNNGVEIDLTEIKKDPLKILDLLSSRENFPSHFVLNDFSSTSDLGGVSKDVVSTLFSNLYEKNKGKYWSPSKFLIAQSEESDFTIYEKLARLISLIDRRNSTRDDKLIIGPIFHPQFFELLKIYIESPSQQEKILKILDLLKTYDAFDSAFYEYVLDWENADKKIAFKDFIIAIDVESFFPQYQEILDLYSDNIPDESKSIMVHKILETNQPLLASFNNLKENLEKEGESINADNIQKVLNVMMRETISEDHLQKIIGSKINNIILSVQSFLNGVSPELNEKICSINSSEELLKIQGSEVTNELVLNSLQIDNAADCAIFNKCVEILKEQISTAEEEWLKGFVQAITGSITLSSETKILIESSEEESKGFEIHTCFNSLKFPNNIETNDEDWEQNFKIALDQIVLEKSYNFV